MSTLSDLDLMVLREEVYPPLVTKNAELTFEEWDNRAIDLYRAVQDIVSGDNVEAYNPATVYDGTSSDVYAKFAGYNSRIWQAVFAGTFSGQTPAEGIYWTQVTLAQLLPNVLKLAEIGSGAAESVKSAKLTLSPAQVLTWFATPVQFGLTVPSGYYVQLISSQLGVDYNTIAYTTNFGAAIRAVGADTSMASNASALNTNVSRIVSMPINTSPSANDTQFIDGADLEVYGLIGAALLGDSNVDIYITYRLVQL